MSGDGESRLEWALRIVRKHEEKHPPEPMSLELERRLVSVWGPMKVTDEQRRRRKERLDLLAETSASNDTSVAADDSGESG